MKIEILATNGIKSAFKELGISAARAYKATEEPHFEVWEVEKSDLAKLENATEWPKGWGWYAYSKGSNLGMERMKSVEVIVPAGIDAHVGADAVSVICDLKLHETKETVLAVDMGTNAEIALSLRGEISACSAPGRSV